MLLSRLAGVNLQQLASENQPSMSEDEAHIPMIFHEKS